MINKRKEHFVIALCALLHKGGGKKFAKIYIKKGVLGVSNTVNYSICVVYVTGITTWFAI